MHNIIKYSNKANFKKTKRLTFKSIKKVLPLKAFQDRYIKDYYTPTEQKNLRKFLNIGRGLLNYALQKRRLLYKFLEYKYYAVFATLKVFPNRFLRKNRRYFKKKLKKKRLNLRMKFFFRINYDNFLFYLNLGNKTFIIKPFNFFNSLFFYKTRTFKKAYVLRRGRRIRFKFKRRRRRYFARKRKKYLKYRFKRKFLMKRLKKLKIKRFTNFIRFIAFLSLCKKINLTTDDNFKINSIYMLPYKLIKFNYNKMNNCYKFFLNFRNRRVKFKFMNINVNFKKEQTKLYNFVKSQLILKKNIINNTINNTINNSKINFYTFETNVFGINNNKIDLNKLSDKYIKDLIFKKINLTEDEYNFIFNSTKPLILNEEERYFFIFKLKKFDRDEKLALIDKKSLTFKEKMNLGYDSEEEFDEEYLKFGELYKTEEEWLYGVDYENDPSYKFTYGQYYTELDKINYEDKYNCEYSYNENDKKFIPTEIYLYYIFYFLIQKLLIEYNWSYSLDNKLNSFENLDDFSFNLINFKKYEELEKYEDEYEDEDEDEDEDELNNNFFDQKPIINNNFSYINILNTYDENLNVNLHDYFSSKNLFDLDSENEYELDIIENENINIENENINIENENINIENENINIDQNELLNINELEIINIIKLIEKICKKFYFFKNKIQALKLKKNKQLSKLFLKFSLIKNKKIKKYEILINKLFNIIYEIKNQLNILFLNFFISYIILNKINEIDNFKINSLLLEKIFFYFNFTKNKMKKKKKLLFSLLFFKKRNIFSLKNKKICSQLKNKIDHRIFRNRWRKRKFYKKFFRKQKHKFFRQINKKFYLPSFELYKNNIKTQINLNVGDSTFFLKKKLKCLYLSNFKRLNLAKSLNNQNFKNIDFLNY